MPALQRIAVVGTSGSGKTTLARQLSGRLGLAHVELDALHWDPGWAPTPAEVFRRNDAMHPILFKIGGVPIYAHGFFLCLGLLIGLLMLIMEAQRRRWPKGEVIPITLAAFVGGMIGARIALLFFYG